METKSNMSFSYTSKLHCMLLFANVINTRTTEKVHGIEPRK